MRFKPAKFKDDITRGFWVTIYLIFDGERVYTFYDEADWIDNSCMMIESGIHIHTFYHDVLCTPTHLPDLYNKVSNVSPS